MTEGPYIVFDITEEHYDALQSIADEHDISLKAAFTAAVNVGLFGGSIESELDDDEELDDNEELDHDDE